jgi:hypothetical protein
MAYDVFSIGSTGGLFSRAEKLKQAEVICCDMEEGDERDIPFHPSIISKLKEKLGFDIVLVKKHTDTWATVRRRFDGAKRRYSQTRKKK